MGLFSIGKKKKDKSKDAETTSQESKSSAKKAKPKRRGGADTLNSVFSESVVEAALNDMRANSRFDTSWDFGYDSTGEELAHVLMALDAQTVGGISKKQSKGDQDKGSFIQSVKGGHIKTYMTADMLADDLIGFICDESTIAAMDEYSFLTNATYHPMLVSDDGQRISVMIGDTPQDPDNIDVSFEEIQDVSAGKKNVNELLVRNNTYLDDYTQPIEPIDDAGFTEEHGSYNSAGDDDTYDDDVDDISAPFVSGDQDLQADGYVPSDYGVDSPDYPVDGIDYSSDIDDVAIDDAFAAGEEISNQAQQSSFEREIPLNQNEDVYIPEAPKSEERAQQIKNVSNFLRDTLFRDDLDLDLALDRFHTTLGDGGELLLFDEDNGEGWLAEGITERAKAANLDLMRMRAANMEQLERRYTVMVTQLANLCADEVSIDTGAQTPFAKEYQDLGYIRKRRLEDKDAEVLARQNRIRELHDHNAEVVAEKAAAAARATYERQHLDELKRELMDIEEDVASDIDMQYHEEVRELNEQRRIHAKTFFEKGLNGIYAELANEASELYNKEQNRYQKHAGIIAKWIDDNRKDDIAYAEALREEQRQAEKSEQYRQEYMNRMQQQEENFKARRAALEEEISDLKLRHENWVAEVNARHAADTEDLRNQNNELQMRYDELLDRYQQLDESKRQEYESRLQASRDEVEAERQRYQSLAGQNKKVWYVWIAFAVVAFVAALCIGMVLGLNRQIDYSLNSATNTSGTVLALPPSLE